jgi:hypothetical protein
MDLNDVGRDWIHVGQDRDIIGSSECSDEHSYSVKDGKFLDYLSNF